MKIYFVATLLAASFAWAQETPAKKIEPSEPATNALEAASVEATPPNDKPETPAPEKTSAAPKDSEDSTAATDFNHRFNVNLDLFGGSYNSSGDASATFTNAGQYPTLTSGEKIPLDLKAKGASGFQAGVGYRFSDWFSWNVALMALRGNSDSTFTSSRGSTHNIKMDSAFLYLTPFTWTAYPISWLYVSAGFGLLVEVDQVTSDIPNINSFTTGSVGSAMTLGAGVEHPIGDIFTLRGGLTLLGGSLTSQERKINEGTASEILARLEERKINAGLLTLGTKIYFK